MDWFWIGSTALTVWMLVDAAQRGVPAYWYLVILCPLGEVAYFLAVKSGDFQPRRKPIVDRGFQEPLATGFSFLAKKSEPVETLRYRLGENPCLENHIRLARGLFDEAVYEESAELCMQALAMDESYVEAHFGAARSYAAMENYELAERHLEEVIDRERSFRDYVAWTELAGLLSRSGRQAEAVDLLERLLRASPRFQHALLLAQALFEAGRSEEAQEQLERALHDIDYAPRHVRRMSRPHLKAARQLLSKVVQAHATPSVG